MDLLIGSGLVLVLALLVFIVVLLQRRSPLEQTVIAEFAALQQELASRNQELRTDLANQRQELRQLLNESRQETDKALAQLRQEQQAQAELLRTRNSEKLEKLDQTLSENAQATQRVLREELELLRKDNETKLEQMRATVDEKLQGTLEKRLGESFKLVSTRLEEVQRGLGEMQTLATDVGGLKRVLTNVKSRGSWGEVQLARQLADSLTPEQYQANVTIKPHSQESVEFAIKLPGRSEDEGPIFLPIDSKFPQEDYERLLTAQENGDKTAVETASKKLEQVVLLEAKRIAEKYIHPPHSTDFAIMYLPTEGLFAEVVRRPGLTSKMHNEHRILVTGPTTLMSLLSSLQMGFRTLAIEQRSSEVWQVLSAAKQEFHKYGEVWAKLEKQLQTAQNTVTEAGRRTRAVERKLRSVETQADTPGVSTVLLPLPPDAPSTD